MSCVICGRSSCTQSFHSIAEQERYEQRQSMTDDVDTLRRMVQDLQEEVESLKNEILEIQERADT